MTDILWPEWLDDIWAKSPVVEGKPGESLSSHTWQVIQKLTGMVELRPSLPERLGFENLWHVLFWACFLHDFGKAAQGFQNSLRSGSRWPHRHEVLSLAFLNWFEGFFSQEEALWIAAAIAFHHKDIHDLSFLYMGIGSCSVESLGQLVDDVNKEVLEGLWRWLYECAPNWLEVSGMSRNKVQIGKLISFDKALTVFYSKGAENIKRRLISLRRWVKEMSCSCTNAIKVGAMALRGHIITSDHAASAHTDPFLKSPLIHPNNLLTQWGLTVNKLYSHQKACLETKGSAVLIAPTGSGKTEAALLWACSQEEKGSPLPRLFYTLPYQVSMNAMYDRLLKSFPGLVGLEHRRSTLALYRRLLEDGNSKVLSFKQAKWARTLSRLYYFPVRVLSPYQMLKAPYRLKGYESILTDLLGAACVFDEIHAYEAGRLAIILAMVKYLREHFGTRFFIMSATMPGIIQNRLTEALGIYRKIRSDSEVFKMFNRHRLFLQEGDMLQGKWLNHIANDAKDGRSVLVCLNTVKRAQQAYEELTDRLSNRVEVELLHSRFNGIDRLEKEKHVQNACGSISNNRKTIVLVATQVIEVSLDIDLDVIYSDPAPLEALIQRFGRINRRCLKKYAPVNVFNKPDDGQHIYDDALVKNTLNVLKKNADKIIEEEELSDWLDQVYSGDVKKLWNNKFEEAYKKFEVNCLQTLRPFDPSENLEELFYQAFDSIEVLPACLDKEYQCLIKANEPLEASQLLVPITWNQYQNLRRKGAVCDKKQGQLKIVEVLYNNKTGLIL